MRRLHVTNTLGQSIEMFCDYGWKQNVLELGENESKTVDMPLPVLPRRYHQIKQRMKRKERLGIAIQHLEGLPLPQKDLSIVIS